MALTGWLQVYAFGVLMWECVSHSPPWVSLRPEAVFEQVIDGVRPLIDQDSCSAGWKELMEDCWCRTPEQRPSMDSVCDQLSAMRRHEDERTFQRMPTPLPREQVLRQRPPTYRNTTTAMREMAIPLIDVECDEYIGSLASSTRSTR